MGKFQNGHKKIGGKTKGSKSAKTKAWEAIGEYLIGEGAERYKSYLLNLKGKEYAIEYRAIIEYFKPKLNKTNLDIKPKIRQIERIYIDSPDDGDNNKFKSKTDK